MKKNLLKRISAFIVTAMLFSVCANAQIVYTDVNPDTTVTCSTTPCAKSYNLDLNNDGTVDFTLYTSRYNDPCFNTKQEVYISSQSGNGTVTLMMNANDTIGSNLAFSASNGILRSVSSPSSLVWNNCISSSGNWTSGTDHYLGLQIAVGSNTCYGWVLLNVALSQPGRGHPGFVYFRVKDYAYNTIPNQPILAGQTTATGIIENSFAASINLYPNPATNHLTIALGSNNKKVGVTITDITGKIIYTTTATDIQKLEVNTADFATGIYVVQIQTADFIATKKLVVEK